MQERRLTETLATLEAERDAALEAAASARRRVAELERALERAQAVDVPLRAAVVELQLALRDSVAQEGSVDRYAPPALSGSTSPAPLARARRTLARVRRGLLG